MPVRAESLSTSIPCTFFITVSAPGAFIARNSLSIVASTIQSIGCLIVVREYLKNGSEEEQKIAQKYDELWKKRHPNKAERDKMDKKISDYELAHTDAIVIEVPKLRK